MNLEIIIWDVNHGNCCVVKLPNGKVMMIDCGSNPLTGFSPILYTKQYWNLSYLDFLIISHPHMDHIRDIMNLEYLKPNLLTRPKIDHSLLLQGEKNDQDLEVINKYIQIDNDYNGTPPPEEDPQLPSWSGGAEIFNYGLAGEQSDFNNYSRITFLKYGGFCFASGGDMSSKGWDLIIEQYGDSFTGMLKTVNFFQVSHHGRLEGFNPIIFNYMNDVRLMMVSDRNEQDTSAVGRYSSYCKGWEDVYNENADEYVKERKVLTTRNDGRIKIIVDIRDSSTVVSVKTFRRFAS
jgi:beta-lactamase superfamily II metal-dependent hydrolase